MIKYSQLRMLNLSVILPDNRILLSKTQRSAIGWDLTTSIYTSKPIKAVVHIDNMLEHFGLDLAKRKKLGVRIFKLGSDISIEKDGTNTKVSPFVAKITESGTLAYNHSVLTKICHLGELSRKMKMEPVSEEWENNRTYSDISIKVLEQLQCNGADIWD